MAGTQLRTASYFSFNLAKLTWRPFESSRGNTRSDDEMGLDPDANMDVDHTLVEEGEGDDEEGEEDDDQEQEEDDDEEQEEEEEPENEEDKEDKGQGQGR
ncbi:hypothetical protein B0H14DRAFT_3493285 [Mycena olivaceomarginata]|nr:hypothetical protein B0H14DRAFT_3493285 [Mycena olivaceomarginata]